MAYPYLYGILYPYLYGYPTPYFYGYAIPYLYVIDQLSELKTSQEMRVATYKGKNITLLQASINYYI